MREKLQKGFTLVELLVVISIIGLLSSIIFAGVRTIRKSGRNTFRNQTAGEYVKAFSLYYDTYGEYPNPGDVAMYCLAETPLTCAFVTTPRPSNPDINNAISEYIKVQEPLPIIYAGSYGWQGLIYQCSMSPSGKCTGGMFTWFLEGNETCISSIQGGYNPNLDLTICQFQLD